MGVLLVLFFDRTTYPDSRSFCSVLRAIRKLSIRFKL